MNREQIASPAVRRRLRDSHASRRRGSALVPLLVTLACVLVLLFFWFLSSLGPRNVDFYELERAVEVSDEALALLEQSRELEARFEEAIAMREEPTSEDLELLRQSIEFQRRYVDALIGFDSIAQARLDKLDRLHQGLAAGRLFKKSRYLEEKAAVYAEQGDTASAIEAYSEAYDLQETINERFPLSDARDPGRAARLQRNIRYLGADPLFRQSEKLHEQAKASAAKEQWDDADRLLEEAIAIQERLNSEFRGTNQASVARLEGLKLELVALRSGQDNLAIERILERADLRRSEGKSLEAASLYDEARRIQRRLNEQYPESPYASTERLVEFQRKSQTAQSLDLGREIERNDDLLVGLLADRRTYEAAEVIVRLSRDIEQLRESFPRSSFNDENLEVKVRYLNLMQADLGFIQDRIYGSVLPIPEVESWRLLRTEVPQALYSLIMGINPSRNQGDVMPVDSVSWIEAKRFCERLSWILGKPVRLPTENEFRQAIGRLRYVVLEEHVWSISQAQGESREVGTKEPMANGFQDLLGNVSEWLESVDTFDNEDALHIGGSAQDTLEAIFTVPVREAGRTERNRLVGFRIVVDLR